MRATAVECVRELRVIPVDCGRELRVIAVDCGRLRSRVKGHCGRAAFGAFGCVRECISEPAARKSRMKFAARFFRLGRAITKAREVCLRRNKLHLVGKTIYYLLEICNEGNNLSRLCLNDEM